MKERPENLTELSKQVFADNKAKGFHDEEYSDAHFLMLVITELSEAVEADRKGKRANLEKYEFLESNTYLTNDIFHIRNFCEHIKSSIDEELADAVIRLLDLAGMRGNEINMKSLPKVEKHINECSFCELIFSIINRLMFDYDIYANKSKAIGEIVAFNIHSIETLSLRYNIDLWRIVEMKMEYNKLRPYKHGKKY